MEKNIKSSEIGAETVEGVDSAKNGQVLVGSECMSVEIQAGKTLQPFKRVAENAESVEEDVNADSGKEDVNGHKVEEDVKDYVEEDVNTDKENVNSDDDDENVDDVEDVNSDDNENVGLEKKVMTWWSKIEEDSLTQFMKDNHIWERDETDKGKSAQIWKKIDLQEYKCRSLKAVQRKARKLKEKAAGAVAKKGARKGKGKGVVETDAKKGAKKGKGAVETDAAKKGKGTVETDGEKGAKKGKGTVENVAEKGAKKGKGAVESDADKGKGEGFKEDSLETNADAEKGKVGRKDNVEAAGTSQEWEFVAERIQTIISDKCDAQKAEMNETYDNIKKAVTKDVLREVKATFYSEN